jgi:thioredoxin 1
MNGGFLLQCSQCGAQNQISDGSAGARHRCEKCGMPLIASNCLPLTVTDATWQTEVIDSAYPCVVFLWSPFCELCANYELSVRKMAAGFFGEARVLLLNVEENPKTPDAYEIRGVPAVLLVRNGELLRAMGGTQGERGIREALGLARK